MLLWGVWGRIFLSVNLSLRFFSNAKLLKSVIASGFLSVRKMQVSCHCERKRVQASFCVAIHSLPAVNFYHFRKCVNLKSVSKNSKFHSFSKYGLPRSRQRRLLAMTGFPTLLCALRKPLAMTLYCIFRTTCENSTNFQINS